MGGSVLLLGLLAFLTGAQGNTMPQINNNVLQEVSEDLQIDDVAFPIDATDPDGDVLTYGLFLGNATYFNVDSATGIVTIKRRLDRELYTVFPLGLSVADGQYTATATIQIIVNDANDNDPIFQAAPYNKDVMENTVAGASLFTVYAKDPDVGLAAQVKYSIEEVVPSNGQGHFSVGLDTGVVTLEGTLDYNKKSTFYRLTLSARDGGGTDNGAHVVRSSTALAFITVLDVPDQDPVFTNPSFTDSVQEHSAVGEPVFTVNAIDQDKGINDIITYSIEHSNAEGLFQISAHDGVISIKSEIDREELLGINYVVILTVMATEAELNIHGLPATASTDVSITITDINDNKPEFYRSDVDLCVEPCSYDAVINEHSSGSVQGVSITVKDLDQGVNANIELTLDGPDKDVFSVTPTSTNKESTVQIMVKNPQLVDYETKTSMVVHVIATDPSITDPSKCCSTATVTIQITDMNDNSPEFLSPTYEIEVPEHTPDDTVVDTITATDPDTMDVGLIVYTLLPESMRRFFDVKPNTGEIFVRDSTLIDREVSSFYSATLQAKDSNKNIGTTILEITLTDINDNAPVINRDSYTGLVQEGPEGQLRLQIQASDADDPDTDNSKILFEIKHSNYSDNFTIDPVTGVLTNRGPLDREAIDPSLNGKIVLNVTATDKGNPPLSTWVEVIIDVEDINDNSPTFIPENVSYRFDVPEGKKGASVGLVKAEDLDQTQDHNRISFSIIEGSYGSFIIRTLRFGEGRYSGNISVDPDIELDYESNLKSFKLTVEAVDLAQRKATVTVDVNVVDINDERPEFKPTGPFTVKENTTVSGEVGRFEATDSDGDHSLVYELISMHCHCQGILDPCTEEWFNLEPSGEITLNHTFVIDYEMCDRVEIEAQVVDVNTEKGENNSVTPGKVVINIEDINDNAPQFIKSDADVFVVVPEGSETGRSVAQVKAEDRDSGIHKQIEFAVTNVSFHHSTTNKIDPMEGVVFTAVTTAQDNFYVGRIQSARQLESEWKGKYLVTVEASDPGPLSTTTLLEIFTVDITFKVELLFRSPKLEVEKELSGITLALTSATKAKVEIVRIREEATRQQSRETSETYVDAYFVFPNGTALTESVVEKLLTNSAEAPTLAQYGLAHIGTGTGDDKEPDTVQFVLVGIVAGLIILLAVMTTSLVCTRRSYQTKLKAAKAMKSAAMMANEHQTSGPVVPGTNKYTMEGANPVLNLNMDTVTDLGFDEDGSSTDRVSLNSLDYNMDMSEKDMMPMRMIQEEDEERGGEPDDIEPLGAALAQRGKKKAPDSPRLTFTNPVFSTTDL